MKEHPDTTRLKRLKGLLAKFVADVNFELELEGRAALKINAPEPVEAAERTYSTFEVATMAGAFHTTIISHANKGLIRATRTMGGHRRFPKDEVVRYLKRAGKKIPLALR